MSEESKCERILAEIKKRRKDPKIVDVEEEKVKLVVFSLCEESFAFHGADIREIVRYQKVTFVPGSPHVILGIINLRGDIESVLSIHRLLGLPDSEWDSRSRIILAQGEGIGSGILVDSVEDVADVPVSSIQPPIGTFDKSSMEFITGVTLHGGRNVTVLSTAKVLGKLSR